MRLENCIPPLEPEVVQVLQDIGVRTEVDLLLADDPINIFTKLPPGHGISLKEFNQIVEQVTEIAAAVPVYGDKLLEDDTKRKEDVFRDDTILVGLPDIDALVGGGFRPPQIVELSGDLGSGRTVGADVECPVVGKLSHTIPCRLWRSRWFSGISPMQSTLASFGLIVVGSSQ